MPFLSFFWKQQKFGNVQNKLQKYVGQMQRFMKNVDQHAPKKHIFKKYVIEQLDACKSLEIFKCH